MQNEIMLTKHANLCARLESTSTSLSTTNTAKNSVARVAAAWATPSVTYQYIHGPRGLSKLPCPARLGGLASVLGKEPQRHAAFPETLSATGYAAILALGPATSNVPLIDTEPAALK